MKKKSQALETVVHGVFLLLGLITVGCVLLISVYLIVSGIPAIRQIGLIPFLFGKTWASTAAEPSYGILPFILTSVYGTAGAIVLGVPIGFLTAVYLAKVAPPRIRGVMSAAVSLLAGIPSVVYGLVGMLVLVPGIRKAFHLADGASLFAAIVVLAIMILPLIMRTAEEALIAVPDSYREGSFGLGAGRLRTVFRIVLPAAGPGILSGVILGIGRIVGETAALIFTAGTMAQIPGLFQSGRTLAIHMYVLSGEALHMNEANATAVVLLLVVLLMNTLSALAAKKLTKK